MKCRERGVRLRLDEGGDLVADVSAPGRREEDAPLLLGEDLARLLLGNLEAVTRYIQQRNGHPEGVAP